jgi:hypothetical protein
LSPQAKEKETSCYKMTAMPQINNPYALPLQSTLHIMTRNDNCYNIFSMMGCQSQMRGGAIKSCLKKGTKAKHRKPKRLVQTAADGGCAFIQEQDCVICAARHQKISMSCLGINVLPWYQCLHSAQSAQCAMSKKLIPNSNQLDISSA